MLDNNVTDYTPLLSLGNRKQNLLQELGFFPASATNYATTDYLEFERKERGTTSMYNVDRGADRQFAGDDSSQYQIIKVPYATLDKVTKPHEVQSFRKIGTKDESDDVTNLVTQRVQHITDSHALYIRDVMYTAIVDNKIYAKKADGSDWTSLAKNYSTLWGAPRATGAINYSATTVDPFIALEEARSNIIAKAGDNASGYQILYLVSSKEFSAMIAHPLVQAAYSQYESKQEPLRRRLGMSDEYSNNRVFEHKGIMVVEDFSGKVADGKGHVLPRGIGNFSLDGYAPSDTVADAGQTAKPGYLYIEETRRSVVIESDMAYACMLTRPELITDITVTYA